MDLFRPEALSFPKYILNEPISATRLHQNEMLMVSPSERQELVSELFRVVQSTEALNTYPSLEPRPLLTAFARSLDVNEENIEVTAGSSQALTLLAEALFAPGRRVAITSPSFSLYAHLARLYGSDVVDINLDDDFEFSPDSLFSDRVLSCNVAILCSPNNPTGTVLASDQILEFVSAFKGVVVVDEAYFEFFAAQGGTSCVPLATLQKNVIVLRTLSKAWAAAGLRVGALVGHPEVIDIFRALKPPYSIAWPSEVLASFVLTQKQQLTHDRVHAAVKIVGDIELLLRTCRGVECVAASKANFVFFKTPRAEALEQEFHQHGFLIRRYTSGRLKDAVRLSAPPPEQVLLVQTILRKVLSHE